MKRGFQEGYVRVLDTTLRDGEQTPGVSLTPEEKVEIARALDVLGVDTIEAGFPITSKGEAMGVKMVASEHLEAEICALARAEKLDIDTALDCDVDAVHVFIATSDIHLQHKLKLSREEGLRRAVEMVEYTKGHGVMVEYSAEDATRTDREHLKRVFRAVEDAGADRLDIADTVGIMTPQAMVDLVKDVRSVVTKPISLHCHQDFGMGTANTLAGLWAGAMQAHLTINGIGERAGNTPLEEVVMSLECLYGRKTRINTKLIYETSRLVSRLTGVPVQPNKAIVGENAFGHESGIHTHGILSLPITYEPLEPELVGRKRFILAGKHAGGHGVQAQLEEMGLHPTREQVRVILERVKELGDKGKRLTDSDLRAIAASVIGSVPPEEKSVDLVDLSVMTGIRMLPTASVKLVVNGENYVAAETGVGPVDSAVKAIQKITSRIGDIRLEEYRLEAITGGTDALAEVQVKVGDTLGNLASARSAGEDIVVTSVHAMIEGINKILRQRKQSAAVPAASP